jgi:hypothetical protein
VIDAQGNGLAVWYVYDGGVTDILSNRYTVGSGWGTARSITTDKTREPALPQIAIDANGNALAVWAQPNSDFNSAIWWNRYAGSGWSTAAQIEIPAAFTDDVAAQIAFDPSGNAVAVWSQTARARGGPSNIVSSRYTAGSAWSSVELIETDNAGDASGPQIAVDANGNAQAVWQQSDGTHDNIVSNKFE